MINLSVINKSNNPLPKYHEQMNNHKNFLTTLYLISGVTKGKDLKKTIVLELKKVLKDAQNILFEGNNYKQLLEMMNLNLAI